MATLMISSNDCALSSIRQPFPVAFFEMSDHFRIGMGVNTEMFAEGLDRISRALAHR